MGDTGDRESRQRPSWDVGGTYTVEVPAVGAVPVTIEDLSEVVSRALPGRNTGPNSPMTQFLLGVGVDRLTAGLRSLNAADADADGVPTPSVLSLLVGYDAVATSVGLAKNQMRRRWPTAGDWYADLTSYVLRPSRFLSVVDSAGQMVERHIDVPFGAAFDRFADWRLGLRGEGDLYQLFSLIRQLLPQYEPVRQAVHRYGGRTSPQLVAVLEQILSAYGLRPRQGVEAGELAWILSEMVTQEVLETVGDAASTYQDYPDVGRRVSHIGRCALLILVGNLEYVDAEGAVTVPTLPELDRLSPRGRSPARRER